MPDSSNSFLTPLIKCRNGRFVRWQFSCLAFLALIVISLIFWRPCLYQRPEPWSNIWELIITLCRCFVSDFLQSCLFVCLFHQCFFHFSFENLLLNNLTKKFVESTHGFVNIGKNQMNGTKFWHEKECWLKSKRKPAGTQATYTFIELHLKQDNLFYLNSEK